MKQYRLCQNCGVIFSIPQWRLNQGVKGLFCSHNCANKSRPKHLVTMNCKLCNTLFSVFPTRIRHGHINEKLI